MTADNDSCDTTEPLSKTARKRQAESLQKMGRRLGELRPDQLEGLQLPSELLTALLDYQRFPSHGAKRRQLQFIGKLLRGLDAHEIEHNLATLEGESAQARFQFNQLEQWRDRLLSDRNALTEFIAAYPHVDRQQLRRLISRTENAANEQQHKADARALFRFLRESVERNDE